MLFRAFIRQTPGIRAYTTSASASGGFYFKYGTPLVKCTVLASATTLAWQLLWQHLDYQEFREESDKHIAQLENRIKSLEEQRKAA